MAGKEPLHERIPILKSILGWMGDNGMDSAPLVATLAFLTFVLSLIMFGVSGGQVVAVAIFLAPLWLPVILFFIFFGKWSDTMGKKFFLSQGRSTLRIKLPAAVDKSPEAMEFVLSQVHATQNADNLVQAYVDGKRPIPMTLELVSIGGEVRFYVNTPSKKVKDAFITNMYAQYPGVEVTEETVDYLGEFPLNGHEKHWDTFSVHMGKKKDQEFPIKTYIDYGMDKLPKEEQKVDPMTPMLEVLGSIAPHERVIIQINCKPHKPKSFDQGQLSSSESWEKGVAKKINEMMKRDDKGEPIATDGDDDNVQSRLTPGERDTITAMERNSGKYAYDTAIRWYYLTEKGKFNGNLISAVIRSFSQYDIIGRNAIGVRWRTDFDYKDFIPGGKKKKLAGLKKQELKEMKLRKFIPKNSAGAPKVFTAEELATVFHLPGEVALTPTLSRIGSTRSEAPANLPIGNLPTK